MEIFFVKSSKARHVRMQFEEDRFKLVKPKMSISNREWIKFIVTNTKWLQKQVAYKNNLDPLTKILTSSSLPIDLGKVIIWGKIFALDIKFCEHFSYYIDTDAACFCLKIQHDIPAILLPEVVSAAVNAVLCCESKRMVFNDLEPHYRTLFNLSVSRVRFKLMKTQWGSLTSKGVMSLNYLLSLAPPGVLDYLYAHELSHIKYKHHGPRFWGLVAKLCPEYHEKESWLKQYGGAMIMYTSNLMRTREDSNL